MHTHVSTGIRTQSLDACVTEMIAKAELVRPANRFFAAARSVERVTPLAALKIARQWQEMTRAFMFTTIASLGLLARRFSTGTEPDREVLGAYQTAYQVIGDDMANVAPEFSAVSPRGVDGVHYVWWADTIVAPLLQALEPAARTGADTTDNGVAALIANMKRLADEPLGAAVQLRVVEAIAMDIAVAFRRVYSKVEVAGTGPYRAPGALDWIDSHIKAETSHASSVSHDDHGMTAMVTTEAERADFARLTEEYAANWARALDDFDAELSGGLL